MSVCLEIEPVWLEHCIHYVLYTHLSMYNEREWLDPVQHNSTILSVSTNIRVRSF